ncbi:hypothetical protein LNL84_04625 [Vibrio sp. ZSDZ34]|uniref:Secreted protein n=1 Tax=Vibrio gelatinilyticus TaxID=2893468 RepID=A0A9X1W8T6_9VIBR|nr:hypothetical protein [Vibrio gelatinilyticus]MCJ2376113.1 hypothetical protein [Vibrio gelatinilyticus]
MRKILSIMSLLTLSFSINAEEGGAPGTICLNDSGLVVTTHLQVCPSGMTKLGG